MREHYFLVDQRKNESLLTSTACLTGGDILVYSDKKPNKKNKKFFVALLSLIIEPKEHVIVKSCLSLYSNINQTAHSSLN